MSTHISTSPSVALNPVDGRESLPRIIRTKDSSSDLVIAPPQTSSVEKGVRTGQSSLPPNDPSCPVKGMFRLLDLITEQGSSGLGNYFNKCH